MIGDDDDDIAWSSLAKKWEQEEKIRPRLGPALASADKEGVDLGFGYTATSAVARYPAAAS